MNSQVTLLFATLAFSFITSLDAFGYGPSGSGGSGPSTGARRAGPGFAECGNQINDLLSAIQDLRDCLRNGPDPISLALDALTGANGGSGGNPNNPYGTGSGPNRANQPNDALGANVDGVPGAATLQFCATNRQQCVAGNSVSCATYGTDCPAISSVIDSLMNTVAAIGGGPGLGGVPVVGSAPGVSAGPYNPNPPVNQINPNPPYNPNGSGSKWRRLNE